MSHTFIYFTTTSAEEAFNIAVSTEPHIYENNGVDKSTQINIDPDVILGQFVANVIGIEWNTDLVEETNIYPAGPKPSIEDWIEGLPEDSPWHKGLHCDQLKQTVREVLSTLPEAKEDVKRMALEWSKIEEWYGRVDVFELENTIRDLSKLARRAKSAQQNLYVYYSI